MKKGKRMLGNDIKWWKILTLLKRNKELELLTKKIYLENFDLKKENQEFKSQIDNRNKCIAYQTRQIRELVSLNKRSEKGE